MNWYSKTLKESFYASSSQKQMKPFVSHLPNSSDAWCTNHATFCLNFLCNLEICNLFIIDIHLARAMFKKVRRRYWDIWLRYFPFPPIIAIQRLRLRYFDWDCQRVGLSEGRGVEILRYFDFEILRLRYFDWDYQRVGLSEGCQASSWWRRLLGGWPPLAVVPTETSLRSHLPPSPTSEKADFLNTTFVYLIS